MKQTKKEQCEIILTKGWLKNVKTDKDAMQGAINFLENLRNGIQDKKRCKKINKNKYILIT